jgi:hypothetical protein
MDHEPKTTEKGFMSEKRQELWPKREMEEARVRKCRNGRMGENN